MSDSLPTVVISTTNGPVIINESDFDPKIHVLFEAPAQEADAFDRKGAKEYLDSLGVQYAKNIKDDALAQLVEDTKKTMAGV